MDQSQNKLNQQQEFVIGFLTDQNQKPQTLTLRAAYSRLGVVLPAIAVIPQAKSGGETERPRYAREGSRYLVK